LGQRYLPGHVLNYVKETMFDSWRFKNEKAMNPPPIVYHDRDDDEYWDQKGRELYNRVHGHHQHFPIRVSQLDRTDTTESSPSKDKKEPNDALYDGESFEYCSLMSCSGDSIHTRIFPLHVSIVPRMCCSCDRRTHTRTYTC